MNDAAMSTILAAIASVICGTLSFLATYLSNRKGQALIAYRIEQLEKKQDKHNNLIERMYHAEEQLSVHDEKIKVANHRIDDLEKDAKGEKAQ